MQPCLRVAVGIMLVLVLVRTQTACNTELKGNQTGDILCTFLRRLMSLTVLHFDEKTKVLSSHNVPHPECLLKTYIEDIKLVSQ